ncbi:MAG: hypothetical protein OEV08_06215 [Nitrospira sp.]|nr:hypothetical protein [Nitrospira sp.]
MNIREWLGLLLIFVALALVPVAWAFSRLLWMLAFVLLILGSWLFYTERIMKKDDQLTREAGGSKCSGRAMPSDIHNYTGWRSGGRSETMDGSSDSGGDDGD